MCPGQKDRVWEEHWMHTLLGMIAGCLCRNGWFGDCAA